METFQCSMTFVHQILQCVAKGDKKQEFSSKTQALENWAKVRNFARVDPASSGVAATSERLQKKSILFIIFLDH